MKEEANNPVKEEVQEAEAQEVQEEQNTEAQEEKIRVVVLAYAGTEGLLKALWEKKFAGDFKIVTVKEGDSASCLLYALAEIMADNEVHNDFVLVRPNCFPAAPCDLDKLQIPLVYTAADGREIHDSRLPVRLNKDTLADLLGSLDKEDDFIPEDFFRKATECNGRAFAAGHNFGNIVFQVLSGNPCRNKVVGALLTKHYIAASLAGWDAIRDILEDYLDAKR